MLTRQINHKLTVSESFYNTLYGAYSSSHHMASSIIDSESSNFSGDINYLDIGTNGIITFLPSSKINLLNGIDPFESKYRCEIKLGRALRKLFVDGYLTRKYGNNVDTFIENLVNYFKAATDTSGQFEIFQGAEICKLYNYNNYYALNNNKVGTMWNSCMKSSPGAFFKLYESNAKMLCLIEEVDGVKKIKARAILWDNVILRKSDGTEETIKFMDRIYTYFDHNQNMFFEWADKNGYYTKGIQSHSHEHSLRHKGINFEGIIYTNLDISDTFYYPYMDTFKYFNKRTGVFSNKYDIDEVIDVLKDDYATSKIVFKLDATNGSCILHYL